jgi:DNA-binding response OmpR family regulator
MKRVLIASIDTHTRAMVTSALESLDVTISECTDGELATRLTAEETDLVVVDTGRDVEPIVQIIERAVTTGLDSKALLLLEPDALTSLRMPSTVVSDFMVRGAASAELLARARGLLWPGEEASTQELVRVDALTINLATYQAYNDNKPIDFTYLEYALFAFLVTHPNRAYSREMLLRRVWGTDYYGGSRTVDVHVRRVRAKIGPELSGRLETVRNVGYLWHS